MGLQIDGFNCLDLLQVTVCDLAARLTALGFDGDAQRAAVHAAKPLA